MAEVRVTEERNELPEAYVLERFDRHLEAFVGEP